jgi:hypothetical protein
MGGINVGGILEGGLMEENITREIGRRGSKEREE